MFGSKSRRILELEDRLDNALTRIGELGQDILTEQNVRRRAIDRAELAENALQAAARQPETSTEDAPRTGHVAALEQRVADLQAANESLTAELRNARAGKAAPIGGAA